MSADLLRRAAALMRERAEAATTHTPWQLLPLDDDYAPPWTVASTHPEGERTYVCQEARHAGEHIASWHPAVALAVADWLDEAADHLAVEDGDDDGLGYVCPTAIEGLECSVLGQALAVAHAYLATPT